jgi:hypothetical protein
MSCRRLLVLVGAVLCQAALVHATTVRSFHPQNATSAPATTAPRAPVTIAPRFNFLIAANTSFATDTAPTLYFNAYVATAVNTSANRVVVYDSLPRGTALAVNFSFSIRTPDEVVAGAASSVELAQMLRILLVAPTLPGYTTYLLPIGIMSYSVEGLAASTPRPTANATSPEEPPEDSSAIGLVAIVFIVLGVVVAVVGVVTALKWYNKRKDRATGPKHKYGRHI